MARSDPSSEHEVFDLKRIGTQWRAGWRPGDLFGGPFVRRVVLPADPAPRRLRHSTDQPALRRTHLAARDHGRRPGLGEIVEHADVGVAAGRDAAKVGVEPIVGRRVQGRHAVGVDRRYPALERDPDQMVDEPVGPEERGHRPVAREHEP